ncbi:hypothetical protein ABPG75_003841 [Micractinium tetrahymenae]
MVRSSRKRGAEESTKEAKRPRREPKAAKAATERSKTLRGATKAGQEPARQTRASSKPLAPLDEEPERLLRQGRAKKQQSRRQGQPKRQEPASGSGAEDVAAALPAAAVGEGGGAMERREGSAGQPDHRVRGQGHPPPGTLQGLLRRLGAGFEDIYPGAVGGSQRVRSILVMLKDEDEMQQLAGLTELCEYLSISTEDTLAAFPMEQVVPLLVNFLGYEHNPDLMLLAARALTFLADVFPPACGSIIRHGAVPAFCARLLTIEYIDLAEQSLQALEKLSHDHPASLLHNGALVAVLSYVDFFQTGVQRVAVATAANMCRGLSPSEHADAVTTAAPILINLLQYQDAKIVDSACLALTRIAEAFSRSPAHLETLCGLGLVSSIVQMVGVSESGSMTSQLQVSTFYGLLKILSTMAGGSHVVAEALLQADISGTLRNLLATSSLLSTSIVSPGNVLRSAEQLGDLVGLAAALLPPIPDAAAAMLQEVPPSPSFDGDAPRASPAPSGGFEGCQRTEFVRDNPGLLQKFSADLLPLMIQVYSSSVTPQVKQRCLTTTAKMLHFNTAVTLAALLEDLPVSSLLAALLSARDSTVVAFGMQMAEILMEKLPDVFSQYFLKEGVVHAIDQLAAVQPAAEAPEPAGAAGEAAGEAAAAAPPPTRPSRRSSASERPASRAADKDSGEAAKLAVRTPAGDTLRAAVGARARRFNARYFTDAKGRTVGCETEGARLLRDICARLPSDPAAVGAVLDALGGAGNASVSTFELLSSGSVAALRDYLQGADLRQDTGPQRQQALLQRLGDFAAAALPEGSGGDPPLRLLVSKLLGALAASEKFVVQLNPIAPPPPSAMLYGGGYYRAGGLPRTTSGASSSLAAGLAALSNPFKIRLSRAGDEPGLRDYATNMVLIEPLASMAQIEDFLWPRVMGGGGATAAAAGAAGADDPRSRQAAAAAARSAGGAAPAEPSVNAAARANAAAAAVEAAAAAAAEAAAAAAAAASRNSQPGDGGRRGRRPASREQPIPQRRMTRAQARLAAEAEVAGQGAGSEEEQRAAMQRELEVAQAAAARAAEAAAAALAEAERQAMMEEEEMLVGGAGAHDEEEDYEDEDMEDGGYVEGEDEEYDEDEDDELDMAAHVHDMHLGDAQSEEAAAGAAGGSAADAATAAGGSAAAPGQTYAQATGLRQQSQAAGAAAAAAARGSSGSGAAQQQQGGGSGAPQPQPHLAFYMGGRLLALGTTIFQAVQQQLAAAAAGGGSASGSGGGSDLSTRLWGEVHTISYRSWGAAMQLQENEAATSVVSPRALAAGADGRARGAFGSADRMDLDGVESGAHDHDDASSSPLAELLDAALPADIVASEDTRDVLAVLRVAEAVNRLAPHLGAWLEGRAGRARRSGAPPPGHLPRDAFLSSKLAPKLNQQLKDVLSICGGALPPWCRQLVHAARFLFPFEARRRFFYCTSFGLARALHYLQQVHAAEHGPGSAADREAAGSLRIGRVQRQKVRISRRRLLDSAFKVFELYAGSKSQLEIEFFNEVGTGLGPTLEFYTLLSHELQRKSLGIWRHDASAGNSDGAGGAGTAAGALVEDAKQAAAAAAAADTSGGAGAQAAAAARSAAGPGPLAGELDKEEGQLNETVRAGDLVYAPQGLFPAPLPPGQRSEDGKQVLYFRLLGRAVAKALQDSRLLDLPLSPVLYRLALQRHVDLYDIRKFDAALGASLECLHAAYHAHAAGGSKGPLLVDGCPLEDLCLTFELPGFPGYPLHPDGAETPVIAANLRQYLDAVVEATLGAGVATQVEAFRSGFEAIFPLDCLAAFYEDEIEIMLCGTGEAWTPEYLAEVIKFDHGYTAQSQPVRALLDVLCELDAVEQRRFLRFVTGTPRLPPGGLAALQPRLTVVRKLSHAASLGAEGTSAPLGSMSAPSGGGSLPAGARHPADGDLPSVMTCANYLKLPPYSTKEVLRERLLYAVTEGQGSFDLS